MNHSAPVPLVLHVVHSLGAGGLENGMVNIINRLPEGRFRHAIACLTQSGDFAGRITAPDVQIIELHKREGLDIALYWRLFKLLWQLRPAIVHTRNIGTIEAQFLSWFIPGARGIHGEHGRDIYDVAGENRKYRLLRKVLSPLISTFIAVSKDLASWLDHDVGIPSRKIVQIYNGVDVDLFQTKGSNAISEFPVGFKDADSIVIGTVGRLAAIKDQATLLRAVRHIIDQNPVLAARIRLVIVGDGPLREELEALREELGLSDICWMPGSRDDVPGLLGMMDVFVLPSLGEGISNTVLEAMASGLPVIATNVGGNPELVEHGGNGLLLPVADVDAFAKAIADVCLDANKRAAMGARSRSRVTAHFTWESTVGSYAAVYDQLCNAQRRELGVL